ncbi:DUF6864 domain-containing function [Salinisphaera japonica]|uniref:DUF6864 domain-containing function n=1 Tax=Salinisphaera japonica TaxID=1304270 RepID=UPI000F4BE6FB|nr:hypothetical protein [Salinisphaera japonica]
MATRIFTGPYEVYSSGKIFILAEDETLFKIGDNELIEIGLVIKVKDGEKRSIKTDPKSGSRIDFVFTNPSGAGYGVARPVEVGTLDSRSLHVSFHLDIKGENEAYEVSYGFFLGLEQ